FQPGPVARTVVGWPSAARVLDGYGLAGELDGEPANIPYNGVRERRSAPLRSRGLTLRVGWDLCDVTAYHLNQLEAVRADNRQETLDDHRMGDVLTGTGGVLTDVGGGERLG